jgi:uncharacterized membrane protein
MKPLFRALKRLLRTGANLIMTRSHMIEVRILMTGLWLAALLGGWLGYLFFTDFSLYQTALSTAVLHLVGGRALGVVTCLSAGLSQTFTILYNFYLEVVIVLVAYGVVVLIMRNVIEPSIFKTQVRQAELAAQRQRSKVKRYGLVGLFLFVMFPFMMTGPVVGSIIGYLLNYRPVFNFTIVFSGTLTSIAIYTLAGQNILDVLGRYIDLEKAQTWGSVIVIALLIGFAIYHFGTVKRMLQQLDED